MTVEGSSVLDMAETAHPLAHPRRPPDPPTTHLQGSPRRWLSIANVAEYLGLSRATVERLIADGVLPSAKVRGRRLIHVDWVDGYLASLVERDRKARAN